MSDTRKRHEVDLEEAAMKNKTRPKSTALLPRSLVTIKRQLDVPLKMLQSFSVNNKSTVHFDFFNK